MVGRKEKKYVVILKKLGNELGYTVRPNEHLANGHYNPDLVWKSGDKLIGFEVEYSGNGPSNKKFVGDAYWLNKCMNLGFIIIRGKKNALRKLLKFLKEKHDDFKKVYLIDAEKIEEQIKEILNHHFKFM